jgi:bifunctional oligoribonuclease and PAP phosphatase NrnA
MLMPVDKALLALAGQRLLEAERILLVSHVRPDGDAVGSLLGLGLTLQGAGKSVQMVLADGMPANFRYLSGNERVRNHIDGDAGFICTLDCSDLGRAGDVLNGRNPPDLNIDHHITNLNFAQLNLVDPKAVATVEIVADLIDVMQLVIPINAAIALLNGLITDTLGFRTSNMTPRALRLAATLMELGVDLPEIYRLALMRRSFEATRYWGAGLAQMERDDGIVWATLTSVDRKTVGYSGRDDADLINVLAAIDNAAIAVIFVEQPDQRIKVSWRAQPGYDVSGIALSFGGGGHPAAAGADVSGELAMVRARVLEATRKLLQQSEGIRTRMV